MILHDRKIIWMKNLLKLALFWHNFESRENMKVAVLGKVDQKGLSFLKENEFKVIEIENFEIQNLKEQLTDVDGILLRTTRLDKEI